MNNKGLIITASSLLVVIIGLAMYIALWAVDVAYKKTIEKNSVRYYREFLKNYPDSKYTADIQHRYDECDYRRVKNLNKESAFYDYIKEHPHSIYVDSAKIFIDDFAYNRALQTTDPAVCRDYIKDYDKSPRAATIQKRLDEMDRQFYNKNINVSIDKLTRYNINEYYRLFPDGKNKSKVEAKSRDLYDYEAYKSAKNTNTKYAWEQYLKNYPQGKYASNARSKIREYEELEYYKNNSLSNGSQPYAYKFGYNGSCSYYGCSEIKVVASYSSDVIATVKNNSDKVIRHAYIRAGRSYSFELSSGYYKLSFYFGNGWYPKKVLANGLKGGFLENESSIYVSSSYLGENIIRTIQLQETIGGNLSEHPCSISDVF